MVKQIGDIMDFTMPFELNIVSATVRQALEDWMKMEYYKSKYGKQRKSYKKRKDFEYVVKIGEEAKSFFNNGTAHAFLSCAEVSVDKNYLLKKTNECIQQTQIEARKRPKTFRYVLDKVLGREEHAKFAE